jgi:hypothetical protein
MTHIVKWALLMDKSIHTVKCFSTCLKGMLIYEDSSVLTRRIIGFAMCNTYIICCHSSTFTTLKVVCQKIGNVYKYKEIRVAFYKLFANIYDLFNMYKISEI